MRQTQITLVARENAEILQDALGALSLCITFLALLFLPGLL